MPDPKKVLSKSRLKSGSKGAACQAFALPMGNDESRAAKFVGCKGSGSFYIFAQRKVAYDLSDFSGAGTVDFISMGDLGVNGKGAYLPLKLKETTEPIGAGMEEAPPSETKVARARLLFKGKASKLVCDQKRCLLLPRR